MAKGIYLEMAHHPQKILDTMDQAARRARSASRWWKLGLGLALGLLGVAALVFIAGAAQDDGGGLSTLACVMGVIAVGAGILLLVARPRFPEEQFQLVRQMLHALRDDTGRRGWVVGWLDMTGSKQEAKKTRTARSAGGKQKVYYTDPWFEVKIKLVDGNRLNLSLTDKVKTKAGSVVNQRTQFAAKLVANPDLYRPGAIPGGSPQIQSDGSGVLSVKYEVPTRQVPVESMLQSLKSLYTCLEPIQQLPGVPDAAAGQPGLPSPSSEA